MLFLGRYPGLIRLALSAMTWRPSLGNDACMNTVWDSWAVPGQAPNPLPWQGRDCRGRHPRMTVDEAS
jgi:hypothetical protein